MRERIDPAVSALVLDVIVRADVLPWLVNDPTKVVEHRHYRAKPVLWSIFGRVEDVLTRCAAAAAAALCAECRRDYVRLLQPGREVQVDHCAPVPNALPVFCSLAVDSEGVCVLR